MLSAFLLEIKELDGLDIAFSTQRWNAMTVYRDGRLVFSFQNGGEVMVEV